MSGRRLAVYSDYVCPFCYLAWPGVRSLLEAGWSVELRAFELRPSPVPQLRELDESKRRAWQQFIEPKARELGLAVREPALFPRTRKAHEAVRYAGTMGKDVALHERLFGAYFGEGRDIGRIDVLVELGATVGIEHTGMKVELDIDQYADAVVAEAAAAAQQGIRAVPAYVVEAPEPRMHMGLLEPDELRSWAEDGRAGR